jgi:hypothetical protein
VSVTHSPQTTYTLRPSSSSLALTLTKQRHPSPHPQLNPLPSPGGGGGAGNLSPSWSYPILSSTLAPSPAPSAGIATRASSKKVSLPSLSPHSEQIYVTDIMNPKIGSTILTRAGLLPPPLPPHPLLVDPAEAPDDASTSSRADPLERDRRDSATHPLLSSPLYSPVFTTNPHSLRRRLLSPPIGHEKSGGQESGPDDEECLIFRSFSSPPPLTRTAGPWLLVASRTGGQST